MEGRLRRLQTVAGFVPRTIYDIGAYRGEFSQMCRRVWGETPRILQFEANRAHQDALSPTDAFFEVLGDEDALPVVYYKTTQSACTTGNSILIENSPFFDDAARETRSMVRLDTLMTEKRLPRPDFLKLDTQGSELLILKGAPQCVASARVILMEVALHEYNQGAPLIAEVLQFMQQKYGFLMFDIVELHYAPQTANLFQVDILLCRRDDIHLMQTRF